ncbi:MAG TPA: hypothetical protein PLE74_10645 [Candidatus Cloacimonadota bacterium]|nr:hypothetical protein [Candidatus Cloacimonadota bacterium]
MERKDLFRELGIQSVSRYETSDGFQDINAGLLLIWVVTLFHIHSDRIWLFVVIPLTLAALILIKHVRKSIVTPRLGKAYFTAQATKRKNEFIQYGFLFLLVPLFVIWAVVDPQGLPSENLVMCYNFGLIPRSFGHKVWYMFILAFLLAPWIYPYYRLHYTNVLLCGGGLLIFVLVAKFFNKNKKNSWQPWTIPAPRNIIQFMITFAGVLLVEFILFTIFKPDSASFIKHALYDNFIFGIGIISSLYIMLLGLGYRLKRMYLYAGLVAIMSSLSNLTMSFKFDQSLLLLLPGIIIVISGIRILVSFMNENPVIIEDSILEDKVLDDTNG